MRVKWHAGMFGKVKYLKAAGKNVSVLDVAGTKGQALHRIRPLKERGK